MTARCAWILSIAGLSLVLAAPPCLAQSGDRLTEAERLPPRVFAKDPPSFPGPIVPPLPGPPKIGVPKGSMTEGADMLASVPVAAPGGDFTGAGLAGTGGFPGALPAGAGSFLDPATRVQRSLKRVVRQLYD